MNDLDSPFEFFDQFLNNQKQSFLISNIKQIMDDNEFQIQEDDDLTAQDTLVDEQVALISFDDGYESDDESFKAP